MLWKACGEGLDEIRGKDFYKKLSFDQQNSLEIYFSFYCLDHACYDAIVDMFDAPQVFRDRPNGGRWIAFGYVHFKEFDYREHMDLTIREAIKRGKLYDGDYDNDSEGINQPPCPMVMIVEK